MKTLPNLGISIFFIEVVPLNKLPPAYLPKLSLTMKDVTSSGALAGLTKIRKGCNKKLCFIIPSGLKAWF